MKKISILFVCFIAILFVLSGCKDSNDNKDKNKVPEKTAVEIAKEKEQNIADKQVKKGNKTIELKDYEGNWVDKENCDGCKSMVSLKLTDRNNANIVITHELISASNAAKIETKVTMADDRTGRFTFNDDGFSNKGEGTITLKDNELTVKIENVTKNNQNNGNVPSIFEGIKIFVKEKDDNNKTNAITNDDIIVKINKNSDNKKPIKFKMKDSLNNSIFCTDGKTAADSICYVVDEVSGKMYEQNNGKYIGNLYHEVKNTDISKVTELLKPKTKTTFDELKYIGYDRGDYKFDLIKDKKVIRTLKVNIEIGYILDANSGERIGNIND